MPCKYCPYMVNIMKQDDLFNKSSKSYKNIWNYDAVAKFILRNKESIKLFIIAYEKKDPSSLK